MRKVILFIAMSLDGYIADEKGNVDWLMGQEPGKGHGDLAQRDPWAPSTGRWACELGPVCPPPDTACVWDRKHQI